ncbi:hypothetical protein ACLMJK_000574, partial [Lecanora helva]
GFIRHEIFGYTSQMALMVVFRTKAPSDPDNTDYPTGGRFKGLDFTLITTPEKRLMETRHCQDYIFCATTSAIRAEMEIYESKGNNVFG